MKRIDPTTVQRILDTADIVDVVSDFVSLKKRGANLIGLCPFHNDRSPSFYVSKAKGICKCFSCGKGGSPVNFIMEHEHMSYNEALRYLARKYNIEIEERELTDEEQQREDDRQAMFAVNEWALGYLEQQLHDTATGRDIGLAYFRERGLSDAMIRRFRLGYAQERRDVMTREALRRGFTEKYLLDTGITARSQEGNLYDRFRGRVIFPVFTISGKVVAFGGRTLRKEKDIAKYVNSPESVIYSKRNELYGLYQAKSAILRNKEVILVEGYMDVISMFQSGVENVVASSGTALTEQQIRLLRRFTEDVTVIYDSDAAGVKASLRGIDMLLKEGMNVKCVQFPPGEDPDSYARTHSSSELEAYLADNKVDFVTFKARVLLDDTGGDPVKRARAISDIAATLAVIPNDITRAVMIQSTATMLNIDEGVLRPTVSRTRADILHRDNVRRQQEAEKQQAQEVPAPTPDIEVDAPGTDPHIRRMRPYEMAVLQYALRYGCLAIGDTTVAEYIAGELADEEITFINADVKQAFDALVEILPRWREGEAGRRAEVESVIEEERRAGREEIARQATDLDDITIRENTLEERLNARRTAMLDDLDAEYAGRILASHPDNTVRALVLDLVPERWTLSKIHTRFTHIDSERERLTELLPRALYELRDAVIECRLRDVRKALADAPAERLPELLTELTTLSRFKADMAKYLGERIIAPRR